ncbi:Zinc finger C2H2-type [Sesbania bispinosa]|nr:Zinc finger C2H2-type [Sesbania bispinosa]
MSEGGSSSGAKCGVCGEKIKNAKYMPAHSLIHKLNVAQCSQCGAPFSTVNALHRHMRVVHNKDTSTTWFQRGNKNLRCPECDKTFSSVQRREEHMNIVHKEERRLRHAKIDLNTVAKE